MIELDNQLITILKKIKIPLARCALFFVFFYFGLLKVLSVSPANPLVLELLEKTMPFMPPDQFLVLFGAFEMLIGLLFILPGTERLALGLFAPHMVMTIMPLFLLPQVSWQEPFVPTMEGQYMLKNIVLIALAVVIGSELKPSTLKSRVKAYRK